MRNKYSIRNHVYPVLVLFLMGMTVHGYAQEVKETQVSVKQEVVQKNAYVYQCAEVMRFVTQVQEDGLWLFLPGKTLKLDHVESASGAKYTAGDVTFWSKGEEAQLSVGKEIYRDCTINRRKSIWETAKLNGVDFRAIGNEPGWLMELKNAATIKLVTDYGVATNIFKTPEPVIDQQARKTIYKTSNDEHDLVITLVGKQCQDTMSDESFETTVVVKLDDKEYKGCGRALH